MTQGVSIHELSKSFGDTNAVDNISVDIAKGELFGFIGPDGAGKTTLIRILCTLLLADKGSATVNGFDVVKDYQKIRNDVGYMPGRFSLYQDLSVEENLAFFATIFGTTIKKNYDLIKDIYVQIEPFKKRRAGALSGGMKQKLALCCALIHKPSVLFLDEPTTGVDPVSRKEFWGMLKRLKEADITIVVSTPYMDEASLCDRVALMQEGKLLQIDTPASINTQFGKELFALHADNLYALQKVVLQYPNAETFYPFGEYLHYTDRRDVAEINSLQEFIKAKGINDAEIKRIEPNIEDCFMRLMNSKNLQHHE